MTVMRLLLFVMHVCMLRECDGARLTAMLVSAMGVVSAGHLGGTCLVQVLCLSQVTCYG